MPASPQNNSTPGTPGNQDWVHVTISRSASEPRPAKGEKIPTPPPVTAQEGWNDNRFLPHSATPTSPPYSGPVETKDQRRAKKAALHPGLNWASCYDDECPVHLSEKQGENWFPRKPSKKRKELARDMEWETSYDAEPGSDWHTPPPPPAARKERRPHKDMVKWQHCFRDNCSAHRWEKVDAGYYPRIVGEDGALSARDKTHRKRRATVRTRLEREEGEKTPSDVERLEKEILDLREQLSRIAENVVAKDQQIGKLDADYRALRRTEHHVAEELAREQRAHDETKEERNGLKLMMRQIGGQLWRRGC